MGAKTQKLWELLDGSKTIIGNTLLIIGGYMRDGMGKAVVVAIGSALTGVGLSHKYVKAKK